VAIGAYEEAVDAFLSQGKYEDAIDACDRAIEFDPKK